MENQETINNLMRKSGKAMPENSNDLYQAIGQLLQESNHKVSAEETSVLVNMLRQLTEEIEISVRIKLADKLTEQDDVPSELLYILASDDIRVAYNILVRGKALDDDDLIKIIKHRTKRHQLAVTARNNLSEAVSGALVETNDKDVIVGLINNWNAKISKNAMNYLVDESQRIDQYQRPLIRRSDLPRDLAERLCEWISDELLDLVTKLHNVDGREIREVFRSTCRKFDENLGEENTTESQLIKQISTANELTSDFLLDSLIQGHVTLFEFGIAELTGARRRHCINFLYDFGEDGLIVLCKAANIEDKNFLAIRRLVRQSQGKATAETLADREILLNSYAEINNTQAKKVMMSLDIQSNIKKFQNLFENVANT